MIYKKYLLASLLIASNIVAREEKKEFDFIIVGSGCAGTIALERLTEDPSVEVLCVDAGDYFRTYNGEQGNPDPSDVKFCRIDDLSNPVDFAQSYADFHQGWVPLVPSKFGLAALPPRLDQNNDAIWENILFGGGSTINAQEYWRGCPWMYDYFANELKLEGWSWNDVQPLHEKIEFTLVGDADNLQPINPVQYPFRGTKGPLLVRIIPDSNQAMVANSIGFPFYKDYQIANFDNGVLVKQMVSPSQRNLTRVVSGYIDYFYQENIRNRPNVHIKLKKPVWRILFDENKHGGNCRAVGIETTTGEKYYAKKEIIIASGFAGSTKLLLLSGVGDFCDLEKLGIKTHIHSPGVGKYISDHFLAFMNGAITLPTFNQNISVIGLTIIARTNPNTIMDFPDTRVQLTIFNRNLFYIPRSFLWPLTSEIKLISANPFEPVSLNASLFNVFTSDGEIKPELVPVFIGIYRLGVDIAFNLNEAQGQPNEPRPSTSQEAIIPQFVRWIVDENGNLKRNPTDEEIINEYKIAYSAQNETNLFTSQSLYQHPMGGCRMGNRKIDPEAVVDHEFKVYGTCNLRVIDNSIMPKIPGRDQVANPFGHPSAWIYMFGEKVSQIIKDKYGYSSIPPKPCNS